MTNDVNSPEKTPEIPYGIKCAGILLALFFGVILAVMQPVVFGIIVFTILFIKLDLNELDILHGICAIVAVLGILFLIIFCVVGMYNTTLEFFNYISQSL